jgi:hypothetical protein
MHCNHVSSPLEGGSSGGDTQRQASAGRGGWTSSRSKENVKQEPCRPNYMQPVVLGGAVPSLAYDDSSTCRWLSPVRASLNSCLRRLGTEAGLWSAHRCQAGRQAGRQAGSE